jgi:beta-glucanase (GH16 family)
MGLLGLQHSKGLKLDSLTMKKRFAILILLLAAACSTLAKPKDNLPMTESASLNGWTLIWNDEFDSPAGSPPDSSKWKHDIGGGGWGNKEWEYYTDLPKNASTDGAGNLVIRAEQVQGQEEKRMCWYGECKFTSARILTQDKFTVTYGRGEARIKVPYGQGIWPAFWMLGEDIPSKGWPECGEIDIMENIGREPSAAHGTVHGPGYSGAEGISHTFTLPNGEKFSDDFHVFAMEWEPNEIRWYVDDNLYGTLKKDSFTEKRWVFDHPFFIIMNVAVGGYWPGYPDETSVFPQTMMIDYVRAYQKAQTGQ